MPLVAHSRKATTDLIGEALAELARPLSVTARLPSRRMRNCMPPRSGGKRVLALWNAVPGVEKRRKLRRSNGTSVGSAGVLHDVECRDRTTGFTTTASDVASPPPHRLPHPRNDLPQYRRRRREIQPREPRVICTKGLAKVQPNPGLIQKELPGRARQFQRPAIEPGQIRRLRYSHRHAGKLGRDSPCPPVTVRP